MAEIDSTVCDLLRRTPVDSGDSGTNWVARECEQAQEREGKVVVCSNGSGRCSFYSEREGQRGTGRATMMTMLQRGRGMGERTGRLRASWRSSLRPWNRGRRTGEVRRMCGSARACHGVADGDHGRVVVPSFEGASEVV